MLVCSSPKLFAAYHVLLRLSMPRHPSCALSSLTTKKLFISCCLSTSFSLSKDLESCDSITFFAAFFKTFSSRIVNQPRASPVFFPAGRPVGKSFSKTASKMVGVLGFEPRTSSLSGTRSNQLSYTPATKWLCWAAGRMLRILSRPHGTFSHQTPSRSSVLLPSP